MHSISELHLHPICLDPIYFYPQLSLTLSSPSLICHSSLLNYFPHFYIFSLFFVFTVTFLFFCFHTYLPSLSASFFPFPLLSSPPPLFSNFLPPSCLFFFSFLRLSLFLSLLDFSFFFPFHSRVTLVPKQ